MYADDLILMSSSLTMLQKYDRCMRDYATNTLQRGKLVF